MRGDSSKSGAPGLEQSRSAGVDELEGHGVEKAGKSGQLGGHDARFDAGQEPKKRDIDEDGRDFGGIGAEDRATVLEFLVALVVADNFRRAAEGANGKIHDIAGNDLGVSDNGRNKFEQKLANGVRILAEFF